MTIDHREEETAAAIAAHAAAIAAQAKHLRELRELKFRTAEDQYRWYVPANGLPLFPMRFMRYVDGRHDDMRLWELSAQVNRWVDDNDDYELTLRFDWDPATIVRTGCGAESDMTTTVSSLLPLDPWNNMQYRTPAEAALFKADYVIYRLDVTINDATATTTTNPETITVVNGSADQCIVVDAVVGSGLSEVGQLAFSDSYEFRNRTRKTFFIYGDADLNLGTPEFQINVAGMNNNQAVLVTIRQATPGDLKGQTIPSGALTCANHLHWTQMSVWTGGSGHLAAIACP